MSTELMVLAGAVPGFLLGATFATRRLTHRLEADACPDPDAHLLSDADRDQIADEFGVHVTAVRRQVSDFADALADGDPVLRARLRRFEQGDR